jgi:hypothetical protein
MSQGQSAKRYIRSKRQKKKWDKEEEEENLTERNEKKGIKEWLRSAKFNGLLLWSNWIENELKKAKIRGKKLVH